MRPNILIFSHWKRPLERDYSSCRLFCSSTLNDHLLPAKQQTNQASNYAAGKQLIFMSGHASKIGNDVSKALVGSNLCYILFLKSNPKPTL